MDRGGQLAFQRGQHLLHLCYRVALDDQRAGSKDLVMQSGVADEVTGAGAQQVRLAGAGKMAGGLALGDQADARLVDELGDSLLVGGVDAGGQHQLWGGFAYRGTGLLDEALKRGAGQCQNQPRVGAELAGAHGQRRDEGVAQGLGVGFQLLRQQQDRIDAAHLGVDRDRLGACLGGAQQGGAAVARASEAYRLDAWVLDQGLAELAAAAIEQREHAFGHVAALGGLLQGAPDQLRGAGVGGVGLDDHRAARGQRGGGIAAGHRERQREVAGTEHRHRTQRHLLLGEGGTRHGGALGQGVLDAYVEIVAAAQDLGEQSELSAGAATLAFKTCPGQAGLGHGALGQGVAEGIDIVGCRLEKGRAVAKRQAAVGQEGVLGQLAGALHLGLARQGVGRGKGLAGGGVDRRDGTSVGGTGHRGKADQMMTFDSHGDSC